MAEPATIRIPHKKDIVIVDRDFGLAQGRLLYEQPNKYSDCSGWLFNINQSPNNAIIKKTNKIYKVALIQDGSSRVYYPEYIFPIRDYRGSTRKGIFVFGIRDNPYRGILFVYNQDGTSVDVINGPNVGTFQDYDASPDITNSGAIICYADREVVRVYYDATYGWMAVYIYNGTTQIEGNSIASYLNRLYVAGQQTSGNWHPDTIEYSGVGDIATWPGDLEVAPNKYGELKGINTLSVVVQTGVVEYLIIYKSEAIFALIGDPASGGSLKMIGEGIGLSNYAKNIVVCNTPYGQLFPYGHGDYEDLYIITPSLSIEKIPIDYKFNNLKMINYSPRDRGAYIHDIESGGGHSIYFLDMNDIRNIRLIKCYDDTFSSTDTIKAVAYIGECLNDGNYNYRNYYGIGNYLCVEEYDTGNGEATSFTNRILEKPFYSPQDMILKGIVISCAKKTYIGSRVTISVDCDGKTYTEYIVDELKDKNIKYFKNRIRGRNFKIRIDFNENLAPDWISEIQYILEPRGGRV